jgi:soluble lytic murein transglycosylase-like protein
VKAMTKEELRPKILEAAAKYGLNAAIVYGICKKESSLDPVKARFELGYKWIVEPKKVKPTPDCSEDTEAMLQKFSWGIMQIMGGVLREKGYKGWLYAIDLDDQLDYSCRHLAEKLKKYGMPAGIAAYNSGSPQRLESGKLKNQEYVDDVLAYSREF